MNILDKIYEEQQKTNKLLEKFLEVGCSTGITQKEIADFQEQPKEVNEPDEFEDSQESGEDANQNRLFAEDMVSTPDNNKEVSISIVQENAGGAKTSYSVEPPGVAK